MLNSYLIQRKKSILLLVAQFIVLLVSLSYLGYFYFTNIFPDLKAKRSFAMVDCFLVNKKLTRHGKIVHRYRADFLVNYSVKGVQYNRWLPGNGLDLSLSRDKSDQEIILAQYIPGKVYSCKYDSANPQVAIFVPRRNWISIFPFIIPSALSIIIFYLFLKNLFFLLKQSTDQPSKRE